ncbi:conjugal transfer protein [Lactococcus lactis]|uniref:conjugal transfer protein n=1 Tax=Lactococcus lactis TaxID=1358 RepID=UPI000A1F68B2|nr:conjugal transfer protein [Lactococcus lactis]OSP86482.1 conjugal transfer protein [Lactococcus lactis]
MFKVKVIDLPVFHNGKRYLKDDTLEIDKGHENPSIFEVLEEIEDNPFKGVKEITLRKALEDAEIDIPDDASRDSLIQLLIDNNLSI